MCDMIFFARPLMCRWCLPLPLALVPRYIKKSFISCVCLCVGVCVVCANEGARTCACACACACLQIKASMSFCQHWSEEESVTAHPTMCARTCVHVLVCARACVRARTCLCCVIVSVLVFVIMCLCVCVCVCVCVCLCVLVPSIHTTNARSRTHVFLCFFPSSHSLSFAAAYVRVYYNTALFGARSFAV